MTISNDAKKLWETYNVRGFVVISLFIQFFLLFGAPLRKRTKNRLVNSSIWLAYLAADWVATFVIGLILHGPASSSIDPDLLVYWAPFLLLHLGGPDTITAYSFEDNELWARHLLEFVGQTATTGYLFFQSLQTNKLFTPTLLMYLAGIIKYGERIRSLYLASLGKFRKSLQAGNGQDVFIERNMLDFLDSRPNESSSNEDAVRVMEESFCLFRFFKRLVLDINFTVSERDHIRDYFMKISSAEEAFKILEIELNLFYEVLYTKVTAFHQFLGHSLRFVSFSSILISLVLWFVTVDKAGMQKVDVKITYTLLIGALAMDIIASMGLVFSDWMICYLLLSNSNFCFIPLKKMVRLKKRTWSRYPTTISEGSIVRYPQRISRMLFYRWSGSIPQYTLDPLMRLHYTKFDRLFGIGESKYYYRTPLCNDLMEFIFNELRAKAQHAKDNPDDAEIISSARGEWTLLANIGERHHLADVLIKPYTVDIEYHEGLSHWYHATEFLMDGDHGVNIKHRRYCTVLSQYMIYLLIKQPTLMSTIAGIGETRYLDISQGCKFQGSKDYIEAQLPARKYTSEKSLVRKLEDLGPRKWEITSKVWVELLCYAATECRPRNLISQVTDGGELLTFVWALMTHLGLGRQYRRPSHGVPIRAQIG